MVFVLSKKPQTETTKSKEVKIVVRQVITLDDIAKDTRKIKLLYILSEYGPISEKTIHNLVYELRNKGLDLNYEFHSVARNIISRDLNNDLLSLKYTGLIEVDNRRRIVVSTLGREFLNKNIDKMIEEEREAMKNAINELKPKLKPIDFEVEDKLRKTK